MMGNNKRVHFIGIGGAGMYPLAEYLKSIGYTVSGSELIKSYITDRLVSDGIPVQFDHNPELVKACDLVVYTSAVKEDNPEIIYATEHGIRCMKRARLLGDIMRSKYTVAVAGTHGKTTTTAMIGSILKKTKLSPTVLVGGTLADSNGSNAIIGSGELFVAEADEYDRSFLEMYPTVAVITSVEEDHLDIYNGIEDLRDSFSEFINRVPFYGFAMLCSESKEAQALSNSVECETITYGFKEEDNYAALNIQSDSFRTTFAVSKNGSEIIENITINTFGEHNVLNALAAIACCDMLNIDKMTIVNGLADFGGVKRRMEILGTKSGVTFIDDYAHHPTEVKNCIMSVKKMGFEKVNVIFQPHLFSRTNDFKSDFARVLSLADKTVLTPIYKAREKFTDKISSNDILLEAEKIGIANIEYMENVDSIASYIFDTVTENEAVIFMGAGDICEKISPKVMEKF